MKTINRNEIILTNINTEDKNDNKLITISLFTNNHYSHLIDNLIGKLMSDSRVLSLSINQSEQRQNVLDDDE